MPHDKDRNPEPDLSFTYICKKYGDWFLELGIQIPPRHYVGGGEK